ncbi:MAG: hypothetical protein F6J93_40590 [Oscillatoria sp. SIO1A7]|nr:hypothetical protein [Oscillatoria sp. SIO1A7]
MSGARAFQFISERQKQRLSRECCRPYGPSGLFRGFVVMPDAPRPMPNAQCPSKVFAIRAIINKLK